MSNEDATHEAPTRRDYMKYGGTIAVGGMLAGCAGDNTDTADDTPESADNEETSTAEDAESDEPAEWSVTLEPSGTMTFTEVPETFATYHGAWADIMASLGEIDRMVATRRPEENFPTTHYSKIPEVDIDLTGVLDIFPEGGDTADKEIFYEANPDINIIDPGTAKTYLDFTDEDIEEIETNVAPFFGSDMRRKQLSEEHPYYSLYEGIERIAQVFRVEDRAAELNALHDEFVSTVELPPASERDWETFMIGHGNENEDLSEFYPTRADAKGYGKQPFHDLGFDDQNNAFIDMIPEDQVSLITDKEGIVEADPDIIIWYGGVPQVKDGSWEELVVEPFNQDPVLSEVTAVQEDRIIPTWYYGGGPVTSLFVTEDLAKAMSPEEFGPFRIGEYDEDEWLFDRRRLASIINGNI